MINKTVMASITGRPNAGKSTLVNKLTGDKVAIVSPKPQTTRNRIFGVVNTDDTQIVLIDTPGYHKARTRLGEYMVDSARRSIADVDAAILMVLPVPNIGTQEEALIEYIKKADIPTILIINKIDTINYEQLLPVMEVYSGYYQFNSIIPVCAKTGEGIRHLTDELKNHAKPGVQLFPDGMTTDQPERQVVAEIIREKLLICLDKEVGHGIAVEITGFFEKDGTGDNTGNPIINIDATIYCEKKSHKGIIIGKNGEMLKKAGQYARADIEHFMGTKVFLQTWVKVKENWRDNQALLRNFGYSV